LTTLLPDVGGPDLLVGLAQPDDAAVYRLGGGRALVVSLDFFTPIVDDPYDYGQIAAANAISDVYAMGGDPLLALSIAAFPDGLPLDVLTAIIHGAGAKVQEAGGVLAGGHTVRDAEPKFGLCVVGLAREDALITKGGARPGDALYLSKPLGTGAISTALKSDRIDAGVLRAAVASMAALSGGAARAALAAGVRGGTDVTGFSLAGHALEMASAAGARLVLEWARVPALEGARAAIADGMVPGGTRSNAEAFGARVAGLEALPAAERALLFDPQTSGGLLLAVPAAAETIFRAAARSEGATVVRIGRVVEGAGLLVEPGAGADAAGARG
jgi:selenide,water dikinase